MYKSNIFIGSREISSAEYMDSFSSIDGSKIGEYAKCSVDRAKEALIVAKEAFLLSKNVSLSQRVAWINDVANKLSLQKEEFARAITIEVGKPIRFSRIEVDRCLETLRLSTSIALEVGGKTIPTDATPSGKRSISFYKRVPCGVVVAITPFNFPLNLAAHKLAPALLMGNSVILKPTPEAPHTAYMFSKLFIESEFAPPNALSLLYGDADIGNTLVSSDIPRVISFTGSAHVGNIITQNAGIKKISLELGGNAATYIDESADIDNAARKCAIGAFVNSGQVCISLQRIYVNVAVYDAFCFSLAREVKLLKLGNPLDEDTFLGPLVNEEAAKKAENWLESAKNEGATVLIGGNRDGRLFEPTVVVNVTEEMKIVCEEVFAPIVSIIGVSGFDEAVEKINNSPYGLQHSIFTDSQAMALRAIDEFEAGGVVINDIPTLRFDIQPYGGIKMSGIGKEGPLFAMEEFTEIKSVIMF
jgi:acyl-CoA reductase-like NAD-dependent aldehyde dehydrogenase